MVVTSQSRGGAETAQSIIQEYQYAAGLRGNWETHWQEISERVWPSQSRLFLDQRHFSARGEKRNEFIFDSTASIGLNRFAAILDSLLTPRNQMWHRLVVDNPLLADDHEVKMWFDEVNRILFKYRYAPRANFASQNQLNYKMLGAYGSGCLYIDHLRYREEKGLRYRNIHLSGVYFKENHQGLVDSTLRIFRYTARQAAQEWGMDKLPEGIRTAAAADVVPSKEREFTFIHCVKPRTDYDPNRADYKGMPYASYYVSLEEPSLIEEGGYDAFPFAISRYEQVPGEVYGRSPAMDVLPSIKTLNEQKKTLLKQGHRAVDPVLLAFDDGVIDSFSLKPGAINPGGVSADGRMLVQPLPVGNVQLGKEVMDDDRAVINDAFLITLFQILVETPQMTATEVLERTKEKGILLAPTIGRQQSEYLGPLIEREFTLLAEMELLPPPPPVLMEAQSGYKVEYESPMSRSARAEEAAGGLRTVEWALSVSNATGDPSILDNFDFDAMAPDVGEINGMPTRWMRAARAIQEIREQRAQAQQEQQAINAAPGAAAIVKSSAAARKMDRE